MPVVNGKRVLNSSPEYQATRNERGGIDKKRGLGGAGAGAGGGASKELTDLSINLANGGGSSEGNTGTSYRDLDTGLSTDTSASNMALDAMTTAFNEGGSLGDRQQTIMEKFASRATLNKEGSEAEQQLIRNTSAENIDDTLASNAKEYLGAIEGQNMGTKTAAVRYLENTGVKRVRDLEKARDNLLLNAKIGEASRLDNLIIEEQKAITDARKTFIDELLGISTESRAQSSEERALAAEERAALGFETPEEARTRDLVAGQATAQLEAVRSLAITAPDAGITTADTYEQAVEKYRNSNTYKRNERAAELELQQVQASINSTNRANQGSGSGGGGGSSGTYSTDLEYLVDAGGGIAAQGGKFNMEQYYDRISRARNDGDRVSIIADTILSNAPAEVRQKFGNDSNAITNLDQAIYAIQSGVETGFFNNAAQYTYNIFGDDYDPKLAEINQYITAALQPYRSNITGAAWGQQETKEYERLFGSTKYTPEALLTRLQGLKDIMLRQTSNALNMQVNPLNTTGNMFNRPLGVQETGGVPTTSGSGGMFSDSDL